MVKALETKGLFQSLAEPNLIASNGKEASFLAGGEYPYPVAQGGAGNNAVTIVFKEFGVRLSFTPTVLGGDLINLKVKPEVSSLDFGNGVSLSGFRVPALSTRRTETEVELQDGQTFAIAGLMNNTVSSTMSKVPGIGDIPILGYLFRSRAYQKAADRARRHDHAADRAPRIGRRVRRACRPTSSPTCAAPQEADAAARALRRFAALSGGRQPAAAAGAPRRDDAPASQPSAQPRAARPRRRSRRRRRPHRAARACRDAPRR